MTHFVLRFEHITYPTTNGYATCYATVTGSRYTYYKHLLDTKEIGDFTQNILSTKLNK